MTVLAGKTAFITGAGKGIGRACAVALAKEGCHLALIARSEADLEEVGNICRNFGVRVYIESYDLTKLTGLGDLTSRAAKELGSLDILINNAGASGGGKADEADLEKWDQVIDTNLKSLMHLTRHALNEIVKQGSGAIINIGSISGKMSFSSSSAYSASKHAVVGFTGCVFEDVREKNIKVSVINPGFVNTDFVSSSNIKREKMIQPQDVADAVLYILKSPMTCCPTEIILRPQNSPF